jgi:hypothetical protein
LPYNISNHDIHTDTTTSSHISVHIPLQELWRIKKKHSSNPYPDGFGGLVVSMLASGTRVRGFDPGWIFSGTVKILSMPSLGKEVKYVSHVPALRQ